MTEPIPLSAPDITEAEIDAVVSVLRTSRLSLGPQMEAFEAAMAALTGTSDAVAVSSGTAGLHLALLALNIGSGDEVIVPSFTFIAVANAVRYVGAHPVFADIDPTTLNLDSNTVEAALTPRTRALIAVHTFGRPADMDALTVIARRHKLALIEDACEAIGATINGRPVGAFGDAAVFAFYPNKQITTGEGGMVVTAHPETARRIRALRNHGRYESGSGSFSETHAEPGFNYRLSEIQCALGTAQLARLDAILARRNSIARRYCDLLAGTPDLIFPATDVPGQRLSWFVFAVRLADGLTSTHRDRIRHSLAAVGIATGRYFAPIHLQPAYAAWRAGTHLPVTESVADRTLALPFFNRLSDEQMERVASTLRAALRSL
ncbi:MAG TPA: DegT/DnrJ/EryC1/StrS family aminotransferase [Acidobacteriaceae bacterium]|jgi:perosamine synthetase|nr:DegT/DnrJ/EryC1/StrS family aminotransferase [Acidobacteriaceae bacterium]